MVLAQDEGHAAFGHETRDLRRHDRGDRLGRGWFDGLSTTTDWLSDADIV